LTAPIATLAPIARASAALLLAALLVSAAAGAEEPSSATQAPAEPSVSEMERSFEGLLDTRKAANKQSAKVQDQIDDVADATDVLSAQYRTTQKQIASIRNYNDKMRDLIRSQEADLASVAQQLDRVDEVGRSVTPLMFRMIDALDEFVKLDVPFLPEERANRIKELRELMVRSDVTNSTKYRQIMDTYQIENEYGRTIEAYRDRIELNGQPSTVDLLRFGRIALVYRTLDGSQTGVWNQKTRSWQPLPDSFASGINEGIRVARKLAPPDLIDIPLLPPDVETASN